MADIYKLFEGAYKRRMVVFLASHGLTNKEIAEKTAMSPQTVRTHLYNSYKMFGITSRKELPEMVHKYHDLFKEYLEEKMRIIGIDPGDKTSGYVVLNNDDGVLKLESWNANISNYELSQVLKQSEYDAIVIENIQSYGTVVGKTVFDTCFWSGRFWQIAEDRGIKIKDRSLGRPSIKASILGKAAAKNADKRIEKYFQLMFESDIKSHAAQALAVAYVFNERYFKRGRNEA